MKIEDHKDLVLVQFFPRDLGCHTAGKVFCYHATSVKREYKLQYNFNLLKLELRQSYDFFIHFMHN